MKTFFDNAPEEDGTQIILSEPLTNIQAAQLSKIKGTDYETDADECFINCDNDDKESVKQMLYNFGFFER